MSILNDSGKNSVLTAVENTESALLLLLFLCHTNVKLLQLFLLKKTLIVPEN
jgi:hypothetical protein